MTEYFINIHTTDKKKNFYRIRPNILYEKPEIYIKSLLMELTITISEEKILKLSTDRYFLFHDVYFVTSNIIKFYISTVERK